jgi:acyl-CoA thioesterase FadM
MNTVDMERLSTLHTRPGFEGSNIRTWVGFKHFGYLVEAAVLQWFRDQGLGPGRLYHEFGLGLEMVECSQLLPSPLDVDDEVTAVARPTGAGRFTIRLTVRRDSEVTVCRARVAVALVREREDAVTTAPEGLHVPVVEGVRDLADPEARRDLTLMPGQDPAEFLRAHDPGSYVWSWRVPYFFCHYSDRVAHSGYLRALEDTVDRFLADRGISVGRMLVERGWIPVVSRSATTMLDDVHVEETMLTTFTVEEVLYDTTYDARMDCYVARDDRLVHVATARIQHGYAISRGPEAGRLADLDAAVQEALIGPLKEKVR